MGYFPWPMCSPFHPQLVALPRYLASPQAGLWSFGVNAGHAVPIGFQLSHSLDLCQTGDYCAIADFRQSYIPGCCCHHLELQD